jgi:hypothetical protein
MGLGTANDAPAWTIFFLSTLTHRCLDGRAPRSVRADSRDENENRQGIDRARAYHARRPRVKMQENIGEVSGR